MKSALLLSCLAAQGTVAYVAKPPPRSNETECRRTSVAILGAGIAGITAAQALVNASISDFVILEAKDYVGGRLVATDFGERGDREAYRVELGANWVHGVGGDFVNPIYQLIQKYELNTVLMDWDNPLTYNETGLTNITSLWETYDEAAGVAEQEAGRLLTENVEDQSVRAGLALAGWNPDVDDMDAALVEWANFDFSIAVPPEESSFIFGTTNSNLTYGLFGDEEPFVMDPRGYNTIVQGEASTFLRPNDPRLLLNTTVTNITHSDTGITIQNSDGTCICAAYAINTFSLGVLQHSSISYTPALPNWKTTAIQSFGMATYTKIFLQFPTTFWPPETELLYYADPYERGHYPVFQSLSTDKYLGNDSNILFVTVTGSQAHRVERQSDEETQTEILQVLQNMFPNTTIPSPTAFFYPRWASDPEFRGSYSYWPIGVTIRTHQNLRANVGRLFFAGEHASAMFFGYAHGSWYSGREMGERVAGLLGGRCEGSAGEPDGEACGELAFYEVVEGDTPEGDLGVGNGWGADSVELEGFEGEERMGV